MAQLWNFATILKSINRIACNGTCATKKTSALSCFSHSFCTSSAANNEKNVEIDSDFTSLMSRGFLRSTKPYSPPSNVKDGVLNVCKPFLNLKGSSADFDLKLGDGEVRFKILTKCIEHFNHDISNSELHKINAVGDLISYFELPVKTSTLFEDLCTAKLPPNVHVQHNYIRFHPETDTKFGGVSAFPRRSTIVTGLKYKKLYKGFKANTSWPYT